MQKLMEWKVSPRRKPLLLKGIRQCGKTWLLREFGKRCFRNLAYFNFEENAEFRQFFQLTKDPRRILDNLALAGGHPIQPGETLVVFDEIQECPDAINALKYFCENASEYHVACAGSLLGVSLTGQGFPVGKVDFLSLHPLSFGEFLAADGKNGLLSYCKGVEDISPLPDAFLNPLNEKLKTYFLTGGMPESVLAWTEGRSIDLVQETLRAILDAYERDFAKHPEKREFPKIELVWHSLPSQLSKENKKFLYKVVKEGARAREYEDAVGWLSSAGLVHKIYRASAPRIPLSAYDDLSAFKLYTADVGLLRRLSMLSPSAFSEGNRLFTEFKGALTENFVLQELIPQFDAMPRYWSRTNPSHEVDFLVQHENDVIPVEVKADRNVRSRSLAKFHEEFPSDVKLKVRFSMENLRLDGDLLNIPLCMVGEAKRLIGIAMGQG